MSSLDVRSLSSSSNLRFASSSDLPSYRGSSEGPHLYKWRRSVKAAAERLEVCNHNNNNALDHDDQSCSDSPNITKAAAMAVALIAPVMTTKVAGYSNNAVDDSGQNCSD